MAYSMDMFADIQQSLQNEIQSIIKAKSTVSYENALALNQELQSRLQKVIQQLHDLLIAVRSKYSDNEQILKTRLCTKKGIGARGAFLRGGTFFFKGNLFFRDARGRCCPNTPDYENRSNAGEMFPMDFNLRARHIWTVRDKSLIVKAIKAQIIEHYELIKLPKSNPNKLRNEVHSKKLVDLLALVEADEKNDFQIDWAQISAIDVGYRHTPKSCQAMWEVYLQPKFNREPWSDSEDNCLKMAAKEHNYQDWETIAAAVGRRSDYQCFVRYMTTLATLDQKSLPWREEDDRRLLRHIEKSATNGVINWAEVMIHFPDKNKSTIIGRYLHTLNPNISREPFSPEEDLLLLAAYEEYDGKFYRIPRNLLPQRSLPQLRSRYYSTLSQRSKIDAWSAADDNRLLEFVNEHGTSQWLKCANELGNHTRQSCRTRFFTIKQFFEKNPNANITDLPRKRTRPSKNGITTENWANKLYELSSDEPPNKQQRLSGDEVNSNDSSKVIQPGTYLKRLRQMQLKLYNFFKYSYNFRVDVDAANQWPISNLGLRICMSSLSHRHPMTTSEHQYDLTLPKSLRYTYDDMLRQLPNEDLVPTGYKLPPSWYTAMGFRALSIQRALTDVTMEPAQVEQHNNTVQRNEQLRKFRQRFRALFYKTAILCRIPTDSVTGLQAALQSAKFPIVSSMESTPVPTLALMPVRVFEPVHRADVYETDATQSSLTENNNSNCTQVEEKQRVAADQLANL